MNNRKLINRLNDERLSKGYSKSFVYNQYVVLANFYCLEDLQIIKQVLSYERHWITVRSRVLMKSNKWIE